MTKRSDQSEYIGKVYGNLTVLGLFVAEGEQVSRASCVCTCGKHTAPRLKDVKNGKTTSCGCQGALIRAESVTKHALSKTREYSIWLAMMQRCNNANHKDYKHYGGRGLKVSPELTSFPVFYEHLGQAPDGHTLDRIDVNKGYELGNVRWASRKVQSRNKRNNRALTYGDKSMCVADWVDETGLSSSLIINRIEYLGWSVEKALSTPPQKRGSTSTHATVRK